MKAIILAAGRGSRMKNLTDERPKCLVELHGKPLLEWQLDSIRKAGISEIGVVTGYKREQLIKYGLEEFNNPRWFETQMVSSLATASLWLEAGDCIVSYSDIFYDATAIESLMSSEADIALTYDPNWMSLWSDRFGDPLIDAETFRIDENSVLQEIGNKPKGLDEVNGQYMGLLKFSPKGWATLVSVREALSVDRKDKIHMTGMLQEIINRSSVSIQAIPYSGSWGEIDQEDDLILYQSEA